MIPRIDLDVVSLKQLSDGPIDVGTRWVETVRAFPGLKVKVDLEVTTHTPDREVGLRFNSKVMSGEGRTICEASDEGT